MGRYNEIMMEREELEMQISYNKHFYNAKIQNLSFKTK